MHHTASPANKKLLLMIQPRMECMGSSLASQSPHGIPAAACVPREQVPLWQQAGGGPALGPHLLNERSIEVYLARGLKPHGGSADAADHHVA